MTRECVTHHHACDCREAKFAKLEAENKRLKQILGLCYWGLDDACTALDHHKIGSTNPLCILQNSITDELGGVPSPPCELEVKYDQMSELVKENYARWILTEGVKDEN